MDYHLSTKPVDARVDLRASQGCDHFEVGNRMQPRGHNLNHQFRTAVREDRETVSAGQQRVNGIHGPFTGGYLSWSHLAELIGDELRRSDLEDAMPEKWWQLENIDNIIRTGDRVLPSDLHDRQLFLSAVQSVFNRCFDSQNDRRLASMGRRVSKEPHRYIARFLGATPNDIPFQPFGFDASDVGFYRITDWNGARSLDRMHVGPVTVRVKPEQNWIEPSLLNAYVADEESNQGSPCPTLVDYEEDTRESANQTLKLYVDENMYYKHVAVRRCLRDHPEMYDAVIKRLSFEADTANLRSLIKFAPSSNIVINVTVQSRDGKVLMMRRQGGARVWKHFFQAGPHETMNWVQPGGVHPENCFDLAARALAEEAGLTDPQEYNNNIVFSWFGFYMPEASAYFFAHVKTRLETDELTRRVLGAHAAWEVDDVQWYELDRSTIDRVLGTWRNGAWSAGRDADGRQYLPHTTVSLTQLWRVSRQGML